MADGAWGPSWASVLWWGIIALNVDWPLEAVCVVGAAAAVITTLVLNANKDKEVF